MESLQIRRFYGTMECLALWPSYIGEKGRTLGKSYGIKVRCYWEHPWELEGNIEGTCWEQRKNEKTPLPTQNLKGKKSRHLECMFRPTHWLHVFLVSQTVGHA
jgi:hypothetical protein